jgi:hypothetical protein
MNKLKTDNNRTIMNITRINRTHHSADIIARIRNCKYAKSGITKIIFLFILPIICVPVYGNTATVDSAYDDRASTISTTPVKIDVLLNDSIPDDCTSPIITVVSVKHGVAIPDNDSILYTSAAGFVGYDTITYSIGCGEKTFTAKVYVLVYDKPDNIVEQEDCPVPMAPFEFKVKQQWENMQAGNQLTGTLVGDLDGDGLPEIIAYTSSTVHSSIPSITIYNGQDGMPKDTVFLSSSANGTGGWHPVMTAAIVDADRNGLGELIFTNPNRTVKSYKTDTTGGVFNMIPNWESATLYDNPLTVDYLPQPIISDFNSDGVPEVLVYTKIYNAVTGHYLGETEAIATAYVGRISGRPGNASSNFIAAADFDGDGTPEIAAGGKVYKVTFNATKTAVTCSVWSQHTSVVDGFTAVADVDMDGNLDVVVVNGTPVSGITESRIQIWTPATQHKFDDISIYNGSNGNSVYQGYPFIGDIDGYVDPETGKRYPEICVTTLNRVSSFKYNPATKQFVSKWTLATSDASGGTGITLFDFNNDGVNEIVYRDETLLRVLNGVADATPVLADPEASFECKSGTSFEYPVIADTDGDGSANICITCAVSYANVPNYLRVYESGSAPWASTSKVWNQVNFEPLQINEDLTVPTFPVPKNTEIAGKYPYNGALIQVPTIVNKEFTVVQFASDPAVDVAWIEEIDASNSKVCVRIENLGVKNTNPILPVALYKGIITSASPVGGANYITSLPVGAAIAPGEKHTLCFTIANTQLDLQMSVRIQDDGTKFPADGSYLDCKLTNNIGVAGLLAMRDYVIGDSINPSVFSVLDNDYCSSCGKGSLDAFDTIANSGPKHGVLTINHVNNAFTYTPAKNFLGIDSIMYYIKCGADSSATKVYILIQKTLSQKYVACPDALVTMGFAAISGVTYHWYNTETGGTTVVGGNPVDALSIIKGSVDDIGTWWVEPHHGQLVFPRSRVDLETSIYCGDTNPTGCASTGRLLYKEDFGGNDVNDDRVSSTPAAPGLIDIDFCSTGSGSCTNFGYSFEKHSTFPTFISTAGGGYDHTYPHDQTRGYYMYIDPAPSQLNFKLYGSVIKGLCTGTNLNFTLWAADFHTQGGSSCASPKIEMIIKDARTGYTIVTSGIFTLPRTAVYTWRQYGFDFTLPSGVDSIVFTIVNKEDINICNDWNLDDIEIRICTPKVTTNIVSTDTIICAGNNLDIVGMYEADCVFGNNLMYQWEFRHVDSLSWKPMPSASGVKTVNCSESPTITGKVSIVSATKADEGYYRMSVSSPANIGSINCRAASDSIYVHVVDKYVAPDIRLQICPSPPSRTVQLSKYLDSTDYDRIEWGQVSSYPVIANLETGLIQNANFHKNGTYTFKYTLRSPIYSGCGESTARVYMRVLNDRVFGRTVDTITICSALATSRSVNLNRIFGLELGGVWSYSDNPDNVVIDNITEVTASSKYAGAVVFNAQKAYAKAGNNYNKSYKGILSKAFEFVYTASSSCVNVTKRVVLVVTP